MPPKSKAAPKGKGSSSGGGGGAGAEEEREQPLQAVVFADSYETRFAPFTLEKPRCLLPLANTPLIEYTLEFLAGVGAEEVFVYCGNFVEEVEQYLKQSKWTKDTSPFSLELIRSPSRSVGDAMRDLDQKQLIVSDFICVYGDVVANVALGDALSAHRARREKDKKAIMTMVLREAGHPSASASQQHHQHRTAAQLLRPTFVIEPSHQRCVHYEQVRPRQTARLDFPEEVLAEGIEFEIREDLIDCGVDICTPEVLAQYTDNFDWQLPRRGFLHGVLKDYETNQLIIHTHVVKDGYAARAKNLRAYDAVSRDVVGRWTYPLVPDANFAEDQSYRFSKGNVYKEDGVVLARSCVINRKTVLGKASSIGEASVISNSVIGRRCVIGKRVRISDAYIWDDARIGDDTVIERSIVANEASVGRKCHLHSGALVSYGVNIANETVIAGKRVTKLKRKRGYDTEEIVAGTTDPKIVGQGGDGFEMEADEEEDEFIETLVSKLNLTGATTGDDTDDSMSLFSDEAEDDEEEESISLDAEGKARSLRSGSFASINSEESGGARRAAADFHLEATTSIVDAMQKAEAADTIQLELQALKLSSNAEDKQVRRAVAVSLARRLVGLVEAGSSFKDAVADTLPPNKLLVQRCVLTGKEVYDEQVEFLLFLQTELAGKAQGDKILLFASNSLATSDLVEAEGFEMWWEDERSSATEDLARVRAETKQLVDVLIGDDESDEEDESDDDE